MKIENDVCERLRDDLKYILVYAHSLMTKDRLPQQALSKPDIKFGKNEHTTHIRLVSSAMTQQNIDLHSYNNY